MNTATDNTATESLESERKYSRTLCFRRTFFIHNDEASFKMKTEHSSTLGEAFIDWRIPAANLENNVHPMTELYLKTASKVKTFKRTRSADRNQKMIIPIKRPKRSIRPVDRLNISSFKSCSYVKK